MQQVTILEQSDIDAAVAPLDARIVRLEARVAALEAAPPPPPADLPGWVLVFEDTFGVDVPLGSFPVAGGKWRAYPTNYSDTSKNGRYDAAKTISVAGGLMKIRMHTTSDGVVHVAAPVPLIRTPSTNELWPGQLYGRYETVARFPTLGAGYKVAWLLWPDSGTNTTGSPSGTGGNGEIDFPEHGLGQQIATSAFMHRQDATVGNDQYQANSAVDLRGFHSFVTEWSRGLCRFLIDGREIGRTTERVPLTSMHYVMQCETQLSGGKPLPGATGEIEVDSVRVWRPA